MPRDGSGNFSQSVADFVNGTLADADAVNARLDDLGDEITNSVAKDGQSTMSGDLDMGGNQVVDIGDATARTDAAKVSQIQDGAYVTGTTGGTANAQTLTPSPAIPAYVALMKFRVKIGTGLTNTESTTFQVSGIASPKTVKNLFGAALSGGELREGRVYELVYDGADVILLGSSGLWVEKKTASNSASLLFTFPTGFNHAEFQIAGIFPGTDGAILRARIAQGGSPLSSGDYYYQTEDKVGSTITTSAAGAQTQFGLTAAVDAGLAQAAINGRAYMYGFTGATRDKMFCSELRYRNNAGPEAQLTNIMGEYTAGSQAAITAIEWSFNSGNIASGAITAVYSRDDG